MIKSTPHYHISTTMSPPDHPPVNQHYNETPKMIPTNKIEFEGPTPKNENNPLEQGFLDHRGPLNQGKPPGAPFFPLKRDGNLVRSPRPANPGRKVLRDPPDEPPPTIREHPLKPGPKQLGSPTSPKPKEKKGPKRPRARGPTFEGESPDPPKRFPQFKVPVQNPQRSEVWTLPASCTAKPNVVGWGAKGHNTEGPWGRANEETQKALPETESEKNGPRPVEPVRVLPGIGLHASTCGGKKRARFTLVKGQQFPLQPKSRKAPHCGVLNFLPSRFTSPEIVPCTSPWGPWKFPGEGFFGMIETKHMPKFWPNITTLKD
ncbi:sporozoite surface protein 2-like [Penaeus monodon]|uniref:sporozoite surface protein 2-like n=1 Tax=Penaeus monodon TaxID=6687 RepID=UPI0018A6EA4B|nr:sporozoite surface protein 2-like [Penaeus monodon]